MPADTTLCLKPATEIADLLARRKVSPLELVDAAIARIEAVDGTVNALPIRCFERARDQARRLDRAGGGGSPGWLGGLPIAVKDYNDLAGVRTTYGSPIFADNVAARSDLTVARLETNGALPIAKSNVPEFAGANTFNTVFGATRNPWNTALSAAGSSGGSAAALAAGMVWLAQGNDLGGSLRTPASFCGVVGLRPSPGRVPRGPSAMPFDPLWVEGPMARNVTDVALMLDAMSGPHLDDPISLPLAATPFLSAVRAPVAPKRVAFSADLGICPVDPEVAALCQAATLRFGDMGASVDAASPDFTGATDCFQTLRAVLFATMRGPLLATDRHRIAPEIVWNIEKGFKLTADDVIRAEATRGTLYHRVAAFFETHDILACPAASVPPFPVEQRYVDEIAGRKLASYIDWIAITFAITLTGCPAIALPCGFTKAGLPVGLQLVGRPQGEAALLGAARRLEEALDLARLVPIEPRG
ncbi:MAG: amidase [Alphaproteobacteria bacterium]|nr:amidase [Alphaproteobacteria bacterium]